MRVPISELIRQNLEKKGLLIRYDVKIVKGHSKDREIVYKIYYQYENSQPLYLELTNKKIRELRRVGIL